MNKTDRTPRCITIDLSNERTITTLAFVGYIVFILQAITPSDSLVNLILSTLVIIIVGTAIVNYVAMRFQQCYENSLEVRFKTILREIIIYVPILLLQSFVIHTFITGQPSNQVAVNEKFAINPFIMLLESVIIVPIYEEVIFRYYPSKFIENKAIYVIVTGFIFAFLHVVKDSSWMIYIWAYIINSIYYSYRFAKTQNLMVTVALHRVNNLMCAIFMFITLKN